MVNDAEDTPPLVAITPVPDTPATAVVQEASEYRVNVTLPVGGATKSVGANVAVSPTAGIATPTVPVVGDAWVAIVGVFLFTTIASDVHTLVAGLLSASPL